MSKWLVSHYESEAGARAVLEERLKHHIQRAHAEIKRLGWRFGSAERAKKADHLKCATSYEVFGALVPHFSTIGLTREETIQVKQEFLAWQRRYDDCRERFLRGENVIWPAGTWAMVEHFGQTADAA